MEDQAILEELLVLLEQNGVVIRNESIGGSGGGLCKIKDKSLFFVDTEGPAADMAVICAQAIHETVDIEKIYLRPQIRDFLERHR
jgi:hypothetical protein